MTTPAIRALKHGVHCDVTLLTSAAGADIAALVPEVDDVISYAAPWMKSGSAGGSDAYSAIVSRLRRGRFDAAVIFTSYSQSALPAAMLCHLAAIPLRLAHCRENPYALLTDWVRDPEPESGVRHEVKRQLDLVAAIGCAANCHGGLSLAVPDLALAAIHRRLAAIRVGTGTPWVILHPGATGASRRYPPDRFSIAARQLIEHGHQVLITGSDDERELAALIQAQAGEGSMSLAGCLELDELAALIGLAPLLITNNTGPAHIAAALGTAVVVLYALTNPQHGPWNTPSRLLFADVPCKFCYSSVCREGHHRCLEDVSPDAVVAAALELLGERAARPRVVTAIGVAP